MLGCFLSIIVLIMIVTAALVVIAYNNKSHYMYDAVKIGMSRSALEKHVGRKPDYEVKYKSTKILGYSIMERGPNDTTFRTADKRPKLVGEYGDLEVLLDSFEVVIAIAYPAGETSLIETADGWVKGECIGDRKSFSSQDKTAIIYMQ